MNNLWDDLSKKVREGVESVVGKTEELTRIGRMKVEIMNIRRNIEKCFAELGRNVYHLLGEEKQPKISSNANVKATIARVKALEKTLREKEEELRQTGARKTVDTEVQPA